MLNRNLVSCILGMGILASMSGCGSSSTSTNAQAAQRWQGTGHYEYEFSDNGCDTGDKNFSNQADYCLALEDFNQNSGCAYNARKTQYESDCGADFQEINEPAVNPISTPVPPTVTPTPAQVISPTPPPVMDLETQVENEFQAHGIQMTVENDGGFTLPNEPTFNEKLQLFWPKLQQVEKELFNYNTFFINLRIATYGDFEETLRNLTLSVDMSTDEIRNTLRVIDRQVSFERKTGIALDLGFVMYDPDLAQKGNDDLNQKISFFETNAANLSNVVKRISLDSSTYYSLPERTFNLDMDNYSPDFLKYLPSLASAQGFFKMIDSLGLSVGSDNIFSSDADLASFASVAQVLAKEQVSLAKLKASGLKTIQLNKGGKSYIYSSLGQISVPETGDDVALIPSILEALPGIFDIEQNNKVEVVYPTNGLGADFVAAAQNLAPSLDLLKTKAHLVNVIGFGDQSSFSRGLLIIGSKDQPGQLQQVISSIQ